MTEDSLTSIARQRQLIRLLQSQLEDAANQGKHEAVGQLSSAILQAQLTLNAMNTGSPPGGNYLTRSD